MFWCGISKILGCLNQIAFWNKILKFILLNTSKMTMSCVHATQWEIIMMKFCSAVNEKDDYFDNNVQYKIHVLQTTLMYDIITKVPRNLKRKDCRVVMIPRETF